MTKEDERWAFIRSMTDQEMEDIRARYGISRRELEVMRSRSDEDWKRIEEDWECVMESERSRKAAMTEEEAGARGNEQSCRASRGPLQTRGEEP